MEPKDNYAVTAKRLSPTDGLDDFPTPPWATRALIEHVIGPKRVYGQMCWDPACNRGYMVKALEEYFDIVVESDIYDYNNEGREPNDFLEIYGNKSHGIHWIITNPPFNKAQQFIEKAQTIATDGVAMLVRTSFLEGIMRHNTLFLTNPPDVVAQFAERVPMVRGRCDRKASTATAYAWLVWYIDNHNEADKKTILRWIPPCRKQLELDCDY
jgi:hypothetical protein